MEQFEKFVSVLNGYAWGLPMVILLVGGGAYLTILSRGIPFLRLRHAIAVIRGKYDNPDDPGEITHFQALVTALSATVGMGNIAGVAVGISQGGPGAVFWMWVTALVGMATKFFTCTLSCMYRKNDELGMPQGGPMYYIEVGLGPKFRPLAVFFSVCGLVGCLAMFQANQLAEILAPIWSSMGLPDPDPDAMGVHFDMSRVLSAVLISGSVAIVVFGGLHRLVQWSEKLVPAMCAIYVVASLVVLALRYEAIPGVFRAIFEDAFTGNAVAGGVLTTVIITGVKRAAFSNEAGIGTAPMAHGAAKTNEPVREGLVAMMGPFIDTIVICSMTALVILVSDQSLLQPGSDNSIQAVSLTSRSFAAVLGTAGNVVVSVSVILFSLTTMFGYSYYGRKCMNYLVGTQRGKVYNYVYVATLAFAVLAPVGLVINILDTAFALMALPNMIATLLLSGRVMTAANDYFSRFDLPENRLVGRNP
jgi:AGCS family alanine or glycine:cation symporter